eukprot:scaffold34935_cov189-Amphora_coffeaeformis.AAC.4
MVQNDRSLCCVVRFRVLNSLDYFVKQGGLCVECYYDSSLSDVACLSIRQFRRHNAKVMAAVQPLWSHYKGTLEASKFIHVCVRPHQKATRQKTRDVVCGMLPYHTIRFNHC